MIPVMCRVKDDPPESYGDCLRACVASMLDLDAEAVPHFHRNGPDSAARGWDEMADFLRTRGLYPFVTRSEDDPREQLAECGHYLLCGSTRSGSNHVVVCNGDSVAHNPAWVPCELIGPCDDGYWTIIVFAKG